MSTQIQRRRGTTAQHSTFTGAVGEVTVDTDKEVLVVHDGAQAGGYPQMRENGSNSALALGSATTPSLKFSGDTNTGIYSPGADQVAISTNGTGRLFINSSGKIGVGTSSPVSTLSVSKNGAEGYEIDPGYLTNINVHYDYNRSGTAYCRHQAQALDHVFFAGTSPTEVARIDSSGRLGLGTSSPGALLHVKSTNPQVIIDSNDASNESRIRWYKNGSSVGSIATDSGNMRILAESALAFTINGGGGGLAESVRIDSSGRVGIGTTGPGFKTEIVDTLQADANLNYSLAIRGDDSGTSGESAQIFLGAINATTRGCAIASILTASANAHEMAFKVSGSSATPTERMRIDSSGRLLVGTSTSASTGNGYTPGLQVAAQNGSISASSYRSDEYGGIIALQKSKSATVGTQAVVSNNDQLGLLSFEGSDGTNFEVAAQIQAYVDGTPGNNDMPGRLVFSTTADGASSPTERMRITSSGETLIGTTSKINVGSDTNDGVVFESQGTIVVSRNNNTPVLCRRRGGDGNSVVFYRDTTAVGSISVTTTATAYNTSSDYRLKENVVPLTGAADRLNQLQVHRFNFIADPSETVDGFIAHEAQAVVPECVTGTKDEVDDEGNPVYQGIDQSKLVPLLTAALQEALAEIESLKARVTALEP